MSLVRTLQSVAMNSVVIGTLGAPLPDTPTKTPTMLDRLAFRDNNKRPDDTERRIGNATKENLQAASTATRESLIGLRTQAEQLGLTFSLPEIDRIKNRADRGEHIGAPEINGIFSRIGDEIERCHFFHLENAYFAYYESSEKLFGEVVAKQFPSAIYELDEASKCIAFARSTAAVFHLMRIMEIGLRSVAECLNIPSPFNPGGQNWGGILGQIKLEIDRRGKAGKTWSNLSDRHTFVDLHASLDSVRNAWRNTTMHVEKKYTQEEAVQIFQAVRAFMMKCSVRFDEAGNPKA
jgi:hypothetical protein